MKQLFLLVLVGLIAFITYGCNRTQMNSNGPILNINAPAAIPTPDRRQQFKGMFISVDGIERTNEIKDTLETIKPSKAGNDFVQVVLKLTPVKDPNIVFEDADSATVLKTTDGKITLRSPYRGTDSQGNTIEATQQTVVPGGGSATEVMLVYAFELARTAKVAKIQLDGFTLNVESRAK